MLVRRLVPALHSVHEVDPAALQEPLLHGSHAVPCVPALVSPFRAVCAGQAAQAESPPALHSPTSHAEQASDSAVAAVTLCADFPTAHEVHAALLLE